MNAELGPYAGKLQQSVNGVLIQHYYDFIVTAHMDDACACLEAQPKVFTVLEVTAPNYILAPAMMMMQPAGGVPEGAGIPVQPQP